MNSQDTCNVQGVRFSFHNSVTKEGKRTFETYNKHSEFKNHLNSLIVKNSYLYLS